MAPAAGPSVCAVIPAFREEGRIGAVVRAALPSVARVIVVDDGSPDRTADEARAAGAEVIRHAVNQGKGAALQTGFARAREAGFEAVVTLDADGQHDPAEIAKFADAFRRTGLPVLVGNRMWDTEHMPLARLCTNRFLSWMLSRMMGQYVPDTQCGYRLYRTDLLPWLATDSGRFAAESEVLLRLAQGGIRIGSVRIRTIYGDEKSKINPVLDGVRIFRMAWRYRRRARPRRREGENGAEA